MLYSINCTVEAERMLRFMERSTIYYLKQKDWTNVQIAEFTGHHRDTIARVLREDVDKHPQTRNRSSAVAVFDAQLAGWRERMWNILTPAGIPPSTIMCAKSAERASRRHAM